MSSSDGSNLWDINCPALAQPVNTALQIALIRLLTSWGTIPHAVVGHSSGEIAASYAAGFITSAEAITAAYYRGKVVSSSDRTGAMLAVGMGADDVQQYVENHGGRIVVACRNSPRSVTLSGDVDAIEAVKAVFDECKIFCKILKTGNKAYHSHHMKSHAESYIRLLQASEISLKRHRDTTGKKRSAAMFSSVTGQLVDYKLAEFGVAYWTENLVKPVLFDAALTALINSDIFTSSDIQLVELGPSSVLEGPIRDIISVHRKTESVFYASVLQRGKDAVVTALNLCGQLYTTGLPVDLQAVNSIEVLPAGKDEPITRITLGKFIPSLPRYQWQYSTRKLAEPRWSKEQRNHKYPRHDLLGRIIPGHSDHTPVWTNFLRLKDLPWLEHHMIGSKVIFPAAGYICMAIEAIRQIQPSVTGELELSSFTIKDLSIHAALVIPEDANGVEIMFSSRVVKAEGSLVFHVRSYVQDKWYDHCDGTIRKNYKSLHAPVQSRKTAKAATELTKFPQRSSAKRWYSHFSTVGFDYGWTFQALQFVGTNPNTFDATANIDIVDRIKQDESRYALHPRTIDGCLQLMLIAMHGGRTKGFNSGYIPVKACEITIWESNLPEMFSEEVGNVTVWNDIRGHRAQQYSAQLVAPDNSLLMEISRMQFVRYETIVSLKKCSTLQRLAVRQPYSHMMWKPDVDLLSPNQAEMLLGSTGAGLENQLSYALKLLIHKYPNSKILILRNIPHAAMAAALEISNELPGKVIVASLSSSFAEALGDVLDTDTLAPGNFKLESLDSINLRGAKYEIVIAPSGTLETVSGLLAAGGRILSLKVDQCDFQSPHLKRIWELPHLSMEMASGDTVKEDILDMVMVCFISLGFERQEVSNSMLDISW
jgi:acyl transferase domain-containing protein